MTSPRRSAKLQLRRSISEQLRDSTSKAWDLLWRNVRERRLAGEGAKNTQKTSLLNGTRFKISINASVGR